MSEELAVLYPIGKIFLITAVSQQVAKLLLEKLQQRTIQSLGFHHHVAKKQYEDPAYQQLTTEQLSTHRLVVRTLAQVAVVPLRKKKARVIIHNLSFHADERLVVEKLGALVGPVVEVNIPRQEVEIDDQQVTYPRKRQRLQQSG